MSEPYPLRDYIEPGEDNRRDGLVRRRTARRSILPHWRHVSASASASGHAFWVRWDGGRVARHHDGRYWLAYDDQGLPLRVSANADGTPYIPQPWHTTKDMPVIWRFLTAAQAKRALDKADPA